MPLSFLYIGQSHLYYWLGEMFCEDLYHSYLCHQSLAAFDTVVFNF